jgi:hypothetical protein
MSKPDAIETGYQNVYDGEWESFAGGKGCLRQDLYGWKFHENDFE